MEKKDRNNNFNQQFDGCSAEVAYNSTVFLSALIRFRPYSFPSLFLSARDLYLLLLELTHYMLTLAFQLAAPHFVATVTAAPLSACSHEPRTVNRLRPALATSNRT